MKNYFTPKMDFYFLECEDVITASAGDYDDQIGNDVIGSDPFND